MQKYLSFSFAVIIVMVFAACGPNESVSSVNDKVDGLDVATASTKVDTKAVEAPQLPSVSLNPTEDIKVLVN